MRVFAVVPADLVLEHRQRAQARNARMDELLKMPPTDAVRDEIKVLRREEQSATRRTDDLE